MPSVNEILNGKPGSVVGSFGNAASLAATTAADALKCSDLLEIRLDLLVAGGLEPERGSWSHLAGVPLLFTARRREEGSPIDLDAARRAELLRRVLDDAALVDIEVASIAEMAPLLDELKRRSIPWVASYHDFEKLPSTAALATAAAIAKDAGAAIFKAAARVHSPADVARLAEFQLADHGLPVSTMGMGPLAPVSRLLCAQSGSVLNYGFIGETSTAPGQWSAEFLKLAISRLEHLRRVDL
jgi:3-dehydroquinate dehydratase-1